jgi:hypothetical protein
MKSPMIVPYFSAVLSDLTEILANFRSLPSNLVAAPAPPIRPLQIDFITLKLVHVPAQFSPIIVKFGPIRADLMARRLVEFLLPAARVGLGQVWRAKSQKRDDARR